MITIPSLIRGRNTLDQLLILMRADYMQLPAGRYYNGPLTEDQRVILMENIRD